jgi:hypothetical protein
MDARSEIVRLAGRRRIRLRDAGIGDLAAIEALAVNSFSVAPELLEGPVNRGHYRPDWFRSRGPGWRVAVAEDRSGAIVAHAYYRLRDDGDVYLRELAAIPPPPARRIRLAATALMGLALADAVDARATGRATLNLVEPHLEAIRRAGGVTPIGFYRRFGLEARDDEPGYSADGGPRFAEDTWMVGRIAEGFHRARAMVVGGGRSALIAGAGRRCDELAHQPKLPKEVDCGNAATQ